MHTTSRLRSNTVPQYFLLFGAGVVESYFHNGATLAHAGKEHSDNDNTVCGSLSVFTGIDSVTSGNPPRIFLLSGPRHKPNLRNFF